jgi:ABC-type uncharacterized transport system substrate-binding protein
MRRRSLIAFASIAALVPCAGTHAQKRMHRVGLLTTFNPEVYVSNLDAIRRGLADTGYQEGQNLQIESRWARGDYNQLAGLAADLVQNNVDVIIATGGTVSANAAKAATRTVPVVFISGADPVAAGLVESLAHPGRNITGVSIITAELMPKRFDFISEMVPKARIIALLVNPTNPNSERMRRETRDAARSKKVELAEVGAGSVADFDQAFRRIAETKAGALVVAADAFFNARRKELVAAAASLMIPAIYEWREYVEAGGLASYGPNLLDIDRLAGSYAGRILAGARPLDLPVEQPTKFELVINLKTANALGLTLPQPVLARADEVIE